MDTEYWMNTQLSWVGRNLNILTLPARIVRLFFFHLWNLHKSSRKKEKTELMIVRMGKVRLALAQFRSITLEFGSLRLSHSSYAIPLFPHIVGCVELITRMLGRSEKVFIFLFLGRKTIWYYRNVNTWK